MRGLGEFLGGESQMLVIDIAEGDDIFARQHIKMSFRAPPGPH
jgi:hypothetical protein